MKSEIEYMALGDTHRIGASAHYLRMGDWGILLDAGLDPHSSDVPILPDYEKIADQPVNAIIISHAHLDHLGSLPVALRYFPHARVYMTPATAALSETMLFHYLRVQEKRALESEIKFQSFYSIDEVENILYLFQSFKYNFPFKIHGFQESDIEVTFWDAGHILGSAGVEITWRKKRLFYTGNTKKSSQFILKGARYPESIDFLITESTYGDNETAPLIKKQNEINRFAQFLQNRINLGGAVVIPVFALGRTQEIMVLLHRLIQQRKINPVPIYLTGFGIKINRIYDNLLHRVYPNFQPKLLRTIAYDTLRGRRYRKPSIILATSGMMMANTVSYEIATDFLTEVRNGIAFVGWADPETPGGTLRQMKQKKVKKVFGVVDLACAIDIFQFSAHSQREELLSMVKQLNPSITILTHGEIPALEWMRDNIIDHKLSAKTYIPEKLEHIELSK
jgi:cleavage and polyadenylation specificity factor subunit 3